MHDDFFLRKKQKSLQEQLASLESELEQVENEIIDRNFETDLSLHDKIKKLQKHFEEGRRKELSTLAAWISNHVRFGSYDEAQGIDEAIEELREVSNLREFPERFGTNVLGEPIDMRSTYPTVISARPGGGKTTIALNVALDILLDGHTVIFFSFEMTTIEIWIKLLLIYIDLKHKDSLTYTILEAYLKNPKSEKGQYYYKIFEELKGKIGNKLRIVNAIGYTASKICVSYDMQKNHFGKDPDFCFVDYIQMIHHQNRDMRIGMLETFRVLVEKAKFTKKFWIMLSQVNKDGQIKESQALTEGAGLIIYLEPVLDDDQNRIDRLRFRVTKNKVGPLFDEEINISWRTGVLG